MFDIDLDSVQEGQEINPQAYNPDEYKSIAEFVTDMQLALPNAPTEIDLDALSVNGKVVQDKMAAYLKNKADGSSALKEVLKNPFAYYFAKNSELEEPEKSHFSLGTFCHMAFLEPELFDLCVVEPAYSRATLDGCTALINFWCETILNSYIYKKCGNKKIEAAKALALAEFPDESKIGFKKYFIECLKSLGRFTSVTENQYQIIQFIKRNYETYGGGIIPLLFRGAKAETSFYGIDEHTGLKVKVRPDAFNIAENIGSNTIISVKTTSAESLEKYFYDAGRYRYSLSEGFYQQVMSDITGRNFNCTINIVLQTVAPFAVAVTMYDGEDIANGKYQARFALDTIKECYDKKQFPGYEALAERGHFGIIQMNVPDWDKKILRPIDID